MKTTLMFILVFLIYFNPITAYSSTHMPFTVVEETGVPQAVLVKELKIRNETLHYGDWIAVFDGNLCVGAASFEGSSPIVITVWLEYLIPGQAPLPGGTPGNDLVFKLWKTSDEVFHELGAAFIEGDGVFGEPLSVVWLYELTEGPFIAVEETGVPQAVLVNDILIQSGPLRPDDRIAVFDGEMCVGVASFEGSYPIVINVWREYTFPGGALQGGQTGNEMSFILWNNHSGKLYLDLISVNIEGEGLFGEPLTVISLHDGITYIESTSFLQTYSLEQNHPNPFNLSTTINYAVPKAGRIVLRIYDVNGRLVRTLADSEVSAGHHQVVWDGHSESGSVVGAGIYFMRMNSGDFSRTIRMLLLK